MTEEWREISGFYKYQISSLGRVKSVGNKRRICYCCSSVQGKIIKPQLSKNGYYSVCLSGKWFLLHRLVAIAFISNPNNFSQVNHKNFNRKDYSLNNLEWMSPSQNIMHSIKHGRVPLMEKVRLKTNKLTMGDKSHFSKLKTTQILEIFKEKGNKDVETISKKYAVSKSAINNIWSGRSWGHITGAKRVQRFCSS